jgi:hypothetical protein
MEVRGDRGQAHLADIVDGVEGDFVERSSPERALSGVEAVAQDAVAWHGLLVPWAGGRSPLQRMEISTAVEIGAVVGVKQIEMALSFGEERAIPTLTPPWPSAQKGRAGWPLFGKGATPKVQGPSVRALGRECPFWTLSYLTAYLPAISNVFYLDQTTVWNSQELR